MGELGKKAGLSCVVRALPERRSDQIPIASTLPVDKRVTRKIGYGKRSITYERG